MTKKDHHDRDADRKVGPHAGQGPGAVPPREGNGPPAGHPTPPSPGEGKPQAGPSTQPEANAPIPQPSPDEMLASAIAERDDLLARLQRVSADFLNYQKRAAREMDDARELAHANVLKAFLPVLDDLERAIEHARANHPADDPLLVGTELVLRKGLGILKSYGVEPMETLGQPFDPSMHEALMQQPTAEVPPMTIVCEAQRGYLYKGRPLRAARVIVAAPAEEQPGQPSQEQPATEDP